MNIKINNKMCFSVCMYVCVRNQGEKYITVFIFFFRRSLFYKQETACGENFIKKVVIKIPVFLFFELWQHLIKYLIVCSEGNYLEREREVRKYFKYTVFSHFWR